ncbi:MAG: LON peptidase substrate-binding domain-containing protein [Syntrophomonadaceae bacterium]
MSRRIPLFPLPEVVLLPGTLLPLHVFEPRYRAMVTDALAGERTIGMTMLAPGADASAAAPPIHRVGTAGEIVESEALPDGRFNILLEARFRFRVIDEDPPDPYRVARVEELSTAPFSEPGEQERQVSSAVDLFRDVARELDLPPLPRESLSPERLASEIALRLRYAPPELQSLLEIDSLPVRFEAVRGRMLEWKGRIQFLAPYRPKELDPRRN